MVPGSIARRSSDVSTFQQLFPTQTQPSLPRARMSLESAGTHGASLADGNRSMVPYAHRANRTSSGVASQRMLPTQASALPLSGQMISEQGAVILNHTTDSGVH